MDRDRQVGQAIVTAAEAASAGVADATRAQEMACRVASPELRALVERLRLHLAAVTCVMDPLAAELSDGRCDGGVAPVSTLLQEA